MRATLSVIAASRSIHLATFVGSLLWVLCARLASMGLGFVGA
jgi:hypothetical protein